MKWDRLRLFNIVQAYIQFKLLELWDKRILKDFIKKE